MMSGRGRPLWYVIKYRIIILSQFDFLCRNNFLIITVIILELCPEKMTGSPSSPSGRTAPKRNENPVRCVPDGWTDGQTVGKHKECLQSIKKKKKDQNQMMQKKERNE